MTGERKNMETIIRKLDPENLNRTMWVDIKNEMAWMTVFFFILGFGLLHCCVYNKEAAWQEAYQNRVYTAPEPEWQIGVPGQPLGYGCQNFGLSEDSEYWVGCN